MQDNIYTQLLEGCFSDPHKVLGLQQVGEGKQTIRLWRPGSQKCELEVFGKAVEAKPVYAQGLYEYEVPSSITPIDYKIFHQDGTLHHDPYAFDKVLGELDVHLLGKGLHYELYNLLGATRKMHQGVMGTHFAVWAPNAVSVALIGDFNHWNAKVNPMSSIGSTGVWEIFIPGLGEGEKYKFSIRAKEGEERIKSDPVAHFAEMRPKSASVVFDVDRFQWGDVEWLEKRKKYRHQNAAINIYEVHLGSWQREGGGFLNYRELASRLVRYCKKMRYTHVELMGISEHPLDDSWGYQVTGYFASTSRYGTPGDFQYLVNALHEEEIGVILDWVPAHFPTDDHSLARFDGTYLYEHIDPRQGFHPHWNTHIFNYGRWEVSNFLIASALYWCEKMHIDGLRVDAVASMLYLDYGRAPGEWVPNQMGSNINLEAVEFLKHMNSIIHERCPDVLMIAEESTTFAGVTSDVEREGLGFDLKWNLGWMNDTLSFFSLPFSERGQNLSSLTFAAEYAFKERYVLVLSHDEVVHGKKSLLEKMVGDDKEKLANLRLLHSFMMCFLGKKLLFMGGEFGQKTEWNFREPLHWELLEHPAHICLQEMQKTLNQFYLENGALFERENEQASFEWIISSDEENAVIAYLRKSHQQNLVCIHHCLPNAISKYAVPLKGVSKVQEVFNTDREEWGGSGIINPDISIFEGHLEVNLPPLATLVLEVEFAASHGS